MFCIKCGANLNDDTHFCNQCGNQIASKHTNQTEPPPQQSAQRFQPPHDEPHSSRVYQDIREPAPRPAYKQAWAADNYMQEGFSHPYQRLGGWLKCFVYAPIVAMGFLTLFTFLDLFGAYQLAQYFDSMYSYEYFEYLKPMLNVILLISLVFYGVAWFITIKFSMMLKNKNPKFLRFYELTMIVSFSVFIIIIILIRTNITAMNELDLFAQSIGVIISGSINFIIMTLYFRKSVRVHIYMGNDDYLKNSIFSKNAQFNNMGRSTFASSPMKYRADNPYTSLGGGLLAFVIIYTIGLFRTIDDVQNLIKYYRYADYYPGLTIAMSAVLLGSVFLIISVIMVITKVKTYRVMFNLSTLSYIAGLSSILIWCGVNNFRLDKITNTLYWIGIVFEVLTLIIWNIYFSSSVRVRKYFDSKFSSYANVPISYSGNGTYGFNHAVYNSQLSAQAGSYGPNLRNNVFTNNAVTSILPERNQYASSQTYTQRQSFYNEARRPKTQYYSAGRTYERRR